MKAPRDLPIAPEREPDAVPPDEAAFVEGELVRMTYQHSWPMSVAVGVTGTGFTAWMFADWRTDRRASCRMVI